MRDDQVRRYARHILLPDVGGLGQTALLTSRVEVEVGEPAGLIAASYFAAGGVGTIVAGHASDAELAELRAYNPDVRVIAGEPGAPVELPAPPPWWIPSAGDDVALAFWRGGIAAVQWMAPRANR